MKPRATVVIPTRNRAPVLRLCLQSLVGQSLPPECFEVIVVDNGSTDDTVAVARSFGDRLNLRVLSEAEPGLHVGRHAGWKAARSSLLMFCDDDIEATPAWVEAVVRRFHEADVALVGGNNFPAWESPPPDWLAAWWQQPVAHGRALGALSVLDFGTEPFDVDPGWIWGCNFNVRAEVLQRSRGFHPDGLPSERLRWRGDGETHVSDVVRAMRLRAVFDGGASVRHRVDTHRMNAAYFEKRGFAQGVSDSYAQIRRDGRPLGPGGRLKRGLRQAVGAAGAWKAGRGAPWRAAASALRRGSVAGWSMHQREVSADPELLAWVLRADYLGV